MPWRKLKRSVSADVEGRPSKAPAEIAVSGLDSELAEAAGASKEEAGDAGDAGDAKISRFANQDLVRDVVIGYTGDEDEDPPQAGSSKERHNRDVQQMISEGLDVPIAKDQRSSYVWVAASKVPENQGVEGNSEMRKKKYTWNPEEIQPVDAVRSKQLRCDICGALCTEVLYEFRCYKRMRPDEPRSVGRRLHPFVSYISKECGQGLLGNPSGASKLRERIYRLLMDTDGLSAVEELEEVWRLGNETMRQILTDELRFLSRTEAGVPRRAAELRKAEAVHGELHKEREDVFRAVARATGPLLNARDLASITIKHAEEQDEENVAQPSEKGKDGGQETSGFLGQVAAALHERKPLPAVTAQWSRADVVSCIQALVNAWRPLRVELHDSLQVMQVFQFEQNSHKQKKRKKEKEKAAPLIRLVYLPGCQELHSISAQSCSREEVQALKEKREGPLKECKEEYAPLDAGQGRYSRAEDRAIELPEGKITIEQVAKALNQITWPNCFTRSNVRPDGAPFIEAFPLGIVLNYSLGLVCSRPTQLWPNLTKLLAMWFAQEQPEFPYTTVQLNKDYATKMHVDGNNHGPSFIIGLGDYTGGEVWILDENGTVEVEIPCTLRGWPHLRPGTKVKGRLEDCHNKWVKFDGNTPHMTMPYKGSRISLVFFTRRGWLRMLPQTKESLESSGFLLPGEDFLNLSTVKEVKEEPEVQKEKKVAKTPEVQEVEETAVSDDEMDEDEKADEVMRAEQDAATWPSWDWGARLRAHLNAFAGTDLSNSNLKVALLGSANVFGMALQELIGSSSFRILTCTEAGGVAMRLMKRTCKPQHAFLNLDAAMAGHGHCDIHHKVCTSGTETSGSEETSIMSEDLLFGSFPCEPFLNQDPARPSCFDDPRSNVFKLLRKHMVVQKPRAALLLVECWQKLPEASRPSVKSFLLEGKDPRIMESDEQALWGLRYLDGYGAAFLEVPLAACGVPLAGQEAMIVLIRDDCGRASAAEAASQLVKSMLSSEPKPLLERCSIHALMFSDEDDRVVQAQQAAKEAYKKGKSRRRCQSATMRRKMSTEVRELGLQPGEAPYTDHLNGIRIAAARMGQQGQTSADRWIKQAPDEKAVHLNLLFARARQHGLDLQNLCVDLSQGFSASGRRDDGLLPRSTVMKEESWSEFYSFNHHRALIGQELLLCFGYPIWRLDFRSISDAEATQLAVRSAAVPAVGICMAAMLAVVELPGKEKLPEKHIANLLDKVEVKEEKPDVSSELQVQAVQAKTEDLHVALDEDGARLESKAAALLNLVSHGAFASRSDDVMQASPSKKRDAANSIFSALSAVAKTTEGDDQVQEKTGTKRKEPEPEEDVPMGLLPLEEEPLDWQVRLRKLTHASSALAPMSLDTVFKWIKEAVEDPDAALSRDVIRKGVAELQRRVSKGEPVSEALFRSRHDLINKLKESGLADLAEEVDIAMRASQLARGFAKNVQQACLDGQTMESMDHYVKTVVRGCDRKGWMMRRVFIHHLSQVAARSLKAGDQDAADKAEQSLIDFGTVGGWPYIISWLKETPDPAKWPSAEVLDQLGTCLPSRTPAQLFAALYAILSSPKLGCTPKSLVRIEKILARNVSQAFNLSTVEHSMPLIKEIAASGPIISARFKTVLKLLAVAMEVREASGNLQSETWQKLLEKIQDLRAAVDVKTSKGWQQLTMSEVDFVEELKAVAERSLKMAMENEEVLRQKQELVQHGQVQERLEQCRLAVLAVANEDGLKEKTKAGLKICLIKMKNLHEAMQKVEVPSPFCTEAWNIGRAAIQDFSECDLRCCKAFQWLREKNLGFCARLLDSCGLLEQLHLIRESPQKLDKVGLPYRCCQLLLATAEKDALSKDTFAPKLEEVPAGWEQNTSRHLNLQYFQKEGQMQWEWPLPVNLVPWRNDGGVDGSTSEQWQQQDEDHAIPEAKHFAPDPSSSVTALDECPYKEGSRCLLCLEDFDDEHESSSMHGQHMKFWKQITDRMAMICLDLEKLPQDGYRQMGLASAWRGELWQALRVSPAPPKSVLAPFWQRVVLRHLAPADSTSENDRETAAGLQALLKDALKAARGGAGNESQETSLEKAEKDISAAVASLDKRVSGLTNISITPAVAALKDLRLAVISSSLYSSGTRSSILDHALKALRQAEAAIEQFCSQPAFHVVVQSWLEEKRLESCLPLLSHRGVLTAIAKGEAVKADAAHGLPTHFSETLSEAWHSEGALRLLRPRRSAPDDWELVYSRSVGLFYYCHKTIDGRAQWPYPAAENENKGNLAKVPNILDEWTRGKPVAGHALYAEIASKGEPICLLCKGQGLEHFASAGHSESIAIWSSIQSRLSEVEHGLNVQLTLTSASSLTSFEMAALTKAWLHEIQHTTLGPADSDDARKQQVSRVFWHLLLAPWSQKATQLVQVQQELNRALTMAGLQEPKWSELEWQARVPPQPHVDFPWPRVSKLKLPQSTPSEVYDALSAQALKSEGITAKADGTLWCTYCDKAVKQLSAHLNRIFPEAMQHFENGIAVKAVVAKLKSEGHQMRCEGLVLSKRRFHCSLCNTSGNWKWICDHRSAPSHRDAYNVFLQSSSPAAAQVQINNKKFKEAELEAWKKAMDQAMDKD